MARNVLFTGASGRVGSAIRGHLSDRANYEFTYLDLVDHPEAETVVADVTDYDDVRPAFDGQDAVVHLAGEASPDASWERVHRLNVLGTYNVMEAVRDAGVPKVIFASSNLVGAGHVDFADGGSDDASDTGDGSHAADAADASDAVEASDAADADNTVAAVSFDHTDVPRPNSYYAVTKLFGEHLGRFYVDYTDAPEQFYAARLGWVLEEAYDAPSGPAERGVDRGEFERGDADYEAHVDAGRRLWCSRRDVAQFVDLALADDAVTYDVFGVRSAGERQWLGIDHTREVLGFEPVDDADESDPPL